MTKIIAASQNPVKIKAALMGFQKMFPEDHFEIEGISVHSGVNAQPKNSQETYRGALVRVIDAYHQKPAADFYVGIEGGIEDKNNVMEAFAWIVINSRDDYFSKSRTGTFVLPPPVADLIRQGKELGEADDIVFGKTNSKQDSGATGILTHNIVDRAQFYASAIILALIPFKNKNLYNIK